MKPKQVTFVDGCTAEIENDGRWDLVLPSGIHIRGVEANLADAIVAVNSQHDQFVLAQWSKGELTAHQLFVVPLT